MNDNNRQRPTGTAHKNRDISWSERLQQAKDRRRILQIGEDLTGLSEQSDQIKNDIKYALAREGHLYLAAYHGDETQRQQLLDLINFDLSIIKKRAQRIVESELHQKNYDPDKGGKDLLWSVMPEEIRKFANAAYGFDWYYDYSDDGAVWRAANQRLKELEKEAAEDATGLKRIILQAARPKK